MFLNIIEQNSLIMYYISVTVVTRGLCYYYTTKCCTATYSLEYAPVVLGTHKKYMYFFFSGLVGPLCVCAVYQAVTCFVVLDIGEKHQSRMHRPFEHLELVQSLQCMW